LADQPCEIPRGDQDAGRDARRVPLDPGAPLTVAAL